ncbi:MAG TPA: hypothetical protein VL357_00035 [Rariglobus sp.]|jgi:hypothetical protein|nr:hypothetical protein [Rariglobus sp.]HTL69535.1 hypothetical protein [Lacunisphaera sp.]
MSDYGGYQQKRAHDLGPFTSVYEATAPDGQPGRFALKIFHPPASTSVRRFYAIEGWLVAAERQQRGANEDGAVLPVVAFGRCPEGAYSVTPWQERTLEPMVETLSAKGDHLRALAECLFNAVEKWGLKPGGSHRKLKSSNIFITKSGPLPGMTVILADPWFMYGIKDENAPRTNDLTAIGAILAQVVRRRAVAGWPIEDGPEWRALGHPGKAWLAYCNYLLNPEPKAGELTLAEARKRLRQVPKDARPVRKAMMIGSAATFVIAGGVLAFARFGNPIYMPDNLRRLAETVKNPRALEVNVPASWSLLCRAWDTWLADLQNNAPRLLKTEALWNGRNDPLRVAITNFVNNAPNLVPGALVPEAAGEKRLGVLGESPPPAVLSELRLQSVGDKVTTAYQQVLTLAIQLEGWPRWAEMRNLLTLLNERRYSGAAEALGPRLPPQRGDPNYGKQDSARTLKYFNDISLDESGTLLLASRWSVLTRLTADMKGTPDRVQQAMPDLILQRLTDHGSVGEFADALAGPLEELRNRREQFLDPAVERERFLKESALLKETAPVVVEDFPRWSQELALYSKVPPAEDPRLAPALDATVTQLNTRAAGLEADAPAPEPGGPTTLNAADFRTEYQQRTADLHALRGQDIVRHDLPRVSAETNQLAEKLQNLGQRLEATLTLLRPDVWLAKVGRPYGQFEETRRRWAAWQQAALGGVTAEALAQDRARFRTLRAQERQMREWVDGLEGENGFGALKVPELPGVSAETADALRRLEAARREQAATAIGVLVQWRDALPATPWSAGSAADRAPLEDHRRWLAALPAFAGDLDRLGQLLAGGIAWREGVKDIVDRLAQHPGLDALTGPPAEWNNEARLLGRLDESTDRAELVGAAQSGGLSRKLTAWRRLGALTGWPAGAADLDIDGAVVSNLRDIVGRDVKDETRRGTLLDELTRETRVRWNRAARNSAASEEQLSAVFERMQRYGITEADLDDPALYDLKLWQLKRSDWTEVDLAPLRSRRDAFVGAVRAIKGMATQPAVTSFVDQLAGIELKVDPNRKPTPSPRLAGWQEELTDSGLGLTATWKGRNDGTVVKLDFSIVQPDDDTPAFYLANRELAVGEFLELMKDRPKAQTDAVMAALPQWAKGESYSKPYDQPMSWRPRIDNAGNYAGIELNPSWFFYTTAAVEGLLHNTELRATNAVLDKAARETPSLRSPVQQLPPEAARAVAERLIGARLPTPREWAAVMKVVGKPAEGNFRGPDFQNLFYYLRDYNVAGQTVPWRPNAGAFLPKVQVEGSKARRTFNDDGHAAASADEGRVWFGPVDEGPVTGKFVNLTGNVSIFLFDPLTSAYYVAGGSALSPPGIDFTQPQKVEAAGLIGAKPGTEPYSDVGIRPAFEAPPGFRERYKLLVLVREQKYLTW